MAAKQAKKAKKRTPKKVTKRPPKEGVKARAKKGSSSKAALKFTEQHEAMRFVAGLLPPGFSKREAEIVAFNFAMFFDGETYDAADWPNTYNPGPGGIDVGGGLSLARFGLGPWAFREKDLADLKLAALAVGVSDHAAKNQYAIPFLLMSALVMIWRLRQRGVTLTDPQLQVLVALRRGDYDGKHLTQQRLGQTLRARDSKFTDAKVEETLAELKEMRLGDGTVEPLVHLSGGRWSTDARGLWEVPFGGG